MNAVIYHDYGKDASTLKGGRVEDTMHVDWKTFQDNASHNSTPKKQIALPAFVLMDCNTAQAVARNHQPRLYLLYEQRLLKKKEVRYTYHVSPM